MTGNSVNEKLKGNEVLFPKDRHEIYMHLIITDSIYTLRWVLLIRLA
jgi:hypothetical protein